MDEPNQSSLVKILELEQKLGYRDTAVKGGLDRFVTRWRKSFNSGLHPDFTAWSGPDLEIEQNLRVVSSLKDYRQSSIEERKTKVEIALKFLLGEPVTIPLSLPVKTAPTQSEPVIVPPSLPVKTTPTQKAVTRDNLTSTSQRSYSWVWAILIGVGLIALFLYGLVPIGLLKIALAIGLIYNINRLSNAPYSSKRGETTQLYHGGRVSMRWKEKDNRKTELIWLWLILIVVVLSIFQQ